MVVSHTVATIRGIIILLVLYGIVHILISSLYTIISRSFLASSSSSSSSSLHPPPCRSYYGRKYVVDNRGRVCEWEMPYALSNVDGCCNQSMRITVPQCVDHCKKTATNRWCCDEFEVWDLACCLCFVCFICMALMAFPFFSIASRAASNTRRHSTK